MDLNLTHEVATLKRMSPRAAETLCRGLRRAHRGQQQTLADQTHRLAAASPGRGRPLRTGPPAGCRTVQRCQSPPLPTEDLPHGPRPGPNPDPAGSLPGRQPSATARHHPDPQVQGPGPPGPGDAGRLPVPGPGLRLAVRRGQGHHRLALQWFSFLPTHTTRS